LAPCALSGYSRARPDAEMACRLLRIIATWDARLLWWFRRFMPQPVYIWITYRMLPGIRHWGEVGDESEACGVNG
jgi:hypothetical protein